MILSADVRALLSDQSRLFADDFDALAVSVMPGLREKRQELEMRARVLSVMIGPGEVRPPHIDTVLVMEFHEIESSLRRYFDCLRGGLIIYGAALIGHPKI
jgi:hypothetical protein